MCSDQRYALPVQFRCSQGEALGSNGFSGWQVRLINRVGAVRTGEHECPATQPVRGLEGISQQGLRGPLDFRKRGLKRLRRLSAGGHHMARRVGGSGLKLFVPKPEFVAILCNSRQHAETN